MAKDLAKAAKYLVRAEEEAKRICSSPSAGKIGGVCWNNEGTVRRQQPWFMGEGSGFDLICFGPDKVTSRGRTPSSEPTKTVRKRNKKRRGKTKKQLEAELCLSLKKRAREGKIPIGFRVYVIPKPKDYWWEIAQRMGGLPSKVDVAHTPYGDLIIVPVNETFVGDKDAPEEPLTDRDGRLFWIPLSMIEILRKVFGPIKWKSPLTFREIAQFGVKLTK